MKNEIKITSLVIPERFDFTAAVNKAIANMDNMMNPRGKMKDQPKTDNSLEMLKEELTRRFVEIEKRAAEEEGIISTWTKIRIAGWVEVLSQKRYFNGRVTKAVKIEFAKSRYNKDITIQLLPTHKKSLLKHRGIIQRTYFI